MLGTDLLTFGVADAVFKIAGEMRWLQAYFDNPPLHCQTWLCKRSCLLHQKWLNCTISTQLQFDLTVKQVHSE